MATMGTSVQLHKQGQFVNEGMVPKQDLNKVLALALQAGKGGTQYDEIITYNDSFTRRFVLVNGEWTTSTGYSISECVDHEQPVYTGEQDDAGHHLYSHPGFQGLFYQMLGLWHNPVCLVSDGFEFLYHYEKQPWQYNMSMRLGSNSL